MSWYDAVKPVDKPFQVGDKPRPIPPQQQGSALGNPIEDPEITCHHCSWKWKMSETSPVDRYKCHKCDYDNTRHYRPDEADKGGILDVTAQRLDVTASKFRAKKNS